MKKLIALYVMFIMLLLVGCAEASPMWTSFPYDYLDYDWSTMTFTNTYEHDILYHTGNSFDDFIILYETITTESFNPSETSAYQELFIIMDMLVIEQNVNYMTIQAYSSSEFKDLCDTNSIPIKLADIVTFNAFKDVIAQINEIDSNLKDIILKTEYVEARLNRTLTTQEIDSLDLLQNTFSDLANYHTVSPLLEYTFEDLLLEFKNLMSYEPNESDLIKLQSAYDIISSLIQ